MKDTREQAQPIVELIHRFICNRNESFGVLTVLWKQRMALILLTPVDVDVSYETKLAKVTLDDSETNIETLISATTNAGYPSKIIILNSAVGAYCGI